MSESVRVMEMQVDSYQWKQVRGSTMFYEGPLVMQNTGQSMLQLQYQKTRPLNNTMVGLKLEPGRIVKIHSDVCWVRQYSTAGTFYIEETDPRKWCVSDVVGTETLQRIVETGDQAEQYVKIDSLTEMEEPTRDGVEIDFIEFYPKTQFDKVVIFNIISSDGISVLHTVKKFVTQNGGGIGQVNEAGLGIHVNYEDEVYIPRTKSVYIQATDIDGNTLTDLHPYVRVSKKLTNKV